VLFVAFFSCAFAYIIAAIYLANKDECKGVTMSF